MSGDHATASRLQFFVGKGGTGKSTLAAATAVALAQAPADRGQARKILLVSLDQAHSLVDVLDTAASSPISGLDVLELDTLSLAEDKFRELGTLLAVSGDHRHGARFDSLAPEELLGVPGVEGILGLHEVVKHARGGDYDVVVVDCPSSAESLRVLGSPAMVADYVERVWPRHERMVAVNGTDARLLVLVSMIERVLGTLNGIRDLLCDRTRTSIRLVATPDATVVRETRRTLSALALSQLNVDAVIVNKILPQGDSDSQQKAIADLTAAVKCPELRSVTRSAVEPVGLADLGEIAGQIYTGDVDAAAVLDSSVPPIRVDLESGSGLDSVYALRMYLPVVDASTLTLGRVEDDLVVGADGVRRRVRLVSVLRRCTVSSAELVDHDLVVRFSPDPEVWPI